MSIWYHSEYRGYGRTTDRDLAYQEFCLYCQTPLSRDTDDERQAELYEEMNYGMSDNFTTRAHAVVGMCPACGWWKYGLGIGVGGRAAEYFEFSAGVLKRLDLTDTSVAIQQVRDYLTAKYESRFDVHPQAFEAVVASVFRDHGYEADVTSYSGDGGIDAILSKGTSTIGVQVKRYKEANRISVAQIRELTGALVIGGYTKGIFVTTSEFQSGADATAAASAANGYPIELVDAPRFYDALKIAQLSSLRELVDRKPWGEIRKLGQ